MDIFLEIMGIIAMILILYGYYLISSNKVDSKSTFYHLLNLIGSAIFVVYLSIKNAWASVALNAAWALIAFVALIAIFKQKKKEETGTNEEES